MTEWRQGKIVRWVSKFLSAEKTSEEDGQGTEPGTGARIERPNSPAPCDERNNKTKETQEWAKTVFAGVAAIVSVFSCSVAQQSIGLAKSTLTAAIERDRRDQRAWVGPMSTLRASVTAGSKATFGFVITNTGKTPARRYIAHTATKSLAKDEAFVATYPQTLPNRYTTVLQPGMRVHSIVQTRGELTPERIDQMKRGERIQYVYGEVFYQDVFDHCHRTVFCVFLLPDLTSFLSCDIYNDMTEVECKEK